MAKQRKKTRPKINYKNLKCQFCKNGVGDIDYKDIYKLKKNTTARGRLIGRKYTGTCSVHQRQLSTAVKKARYMALMPFVQYS